MAAPTERMRELETLLARIRNAGNIQLNYDMWEQHGAQHATPEYAATMRADLAEANRDHDAATTALEALVAATRIEAPGEIAAWADAHDAYLAAFLDDCRARENSDGTAEKVATQERAEWAEVRAGTRALVKENLFYVTSNPERYRRLFGVDWNTATLVSNLEPLLHQVANPGEVAPTEETYDLALASGLTDAERSTFISRLCEAATGGDRRAILTLGHLGGDVARRALFALAKTPDAQGLAARRALVVVGDGASFVQEIAQDAVSSPSPLDRAAAVMDLAKIRGPIALGALQVKLSDADSTVRLLAWDGLVAAYELAPHLQNPESKRELSTQVELLRVLLGSDLGAFVRMGADEMCWLVRWLDAGASPASLGIAWRAPAAPEMFARLRVALLDPDATFPLDEIAALTGVPRRLAETMIALRLEEHDPRVPEAMVRLAATWTLPVLDEVVKSEATSPALREHLTQSIRALQKTPPVPWTLAFRSSGSNTVETYERVLSTVAGSPVTSVQGPLGGNPRDYFYCDLTITAFRPFDGLRLEMYLKQDLATPTDSQPINALESVTLRAAAGMRFAAKLAIWHALCDALADLGCTDGTLAASPAPIVDEAEAAGDTATATRLRAGITAALVAQAPSRNYVSLWSTRADDIEAVLAAYVEPQRFDSVFLEDCIEGALPAGLARFSNIEHLSLAQNHIDGPALRGLALPKLTSLVLWGSTIRRVSRDDLTGVPGLTGLFLFDSPLEELDPDLIEVCPNLRRVVIRNTPLARDTGKLAALHERWKDVVWE